MNRKLRIAQVLMVLTILLIVAVQAYWLVKLFHNEREDLRRETDVIFRETVYKLQVARFKKDTLINRVVDDLANESLFNIEAVTALKKGKQKNEVKKLKPDTTGKRTRTSSHNGKFIVINNVGSGDSLRRMMLAGRDSVPAYVQIYYEGNKDSIAEMLRGADINHQVLTKVLNIAMNDTAAVSIKKRIAGSTGKSHALRVHQTIDFVRSGIDSPASTEFPQGRLFTNNETVNDSLPVAQIDSALRSDLRRAGIDLAFSLSKTVGKKPVVPPQQDKIITQPASVGFVAPYYYQATFAEPTTYIIQKISPQVTFTALLIAFTIISFVVLYRNMMWQKRLADIKNEFISNITHELKTPIATVNVAIEAMQKFNVLQSPERTKEYLDISAMELQRLSLLVDKVLKLSMFEKKEIELKKHKFDLDELVREVMASMKLQFEKAKADVSLKVNGEDFTIDADRMHIMSVVYNLLDNALKYGRSIPVIHITLQDAGEEVLMKIDDNGIGIPAEYRERIFEKFFRVPANDTHNIKGYGLGLSYVSHIINRHQGHIKVESVEGKGSTFIIQLPKQTG